MEQSSASQEAEAMTRDEIISMAREAGAKVFGEKIVIADNASSGDGSDFVPRFAALVAAREREACGRLTGTRPVSKGRPFERVSSPAQSTLQEHDK